MHIADVYDFETMLRYCIQNLHWRIDDDLFEDLDELTYDFSADDFGLKAEEFAKVKNIRQLRPIVDGQPWGIFSVDFESKKIDVTALRKILSKLVPSYRGREYQTWSMDHLLFLCTWGEAAYRTVGFILFEQQDHALPIIKPIYCAPRVEDQFVLDSFEQKIKFLEWPQSESDSIAWITSWTAAFHQAKGTIIRSVRGITEELAQTALRITENLTNAYEIEIESGIIHRLFNRFNEALCINLTEKDFFSMYAQTIVFGLFSARCMRPDVLPFTPSIALDCLPVTNPLLRDLLAECFAEGGYLEYDELDVCNLIEYLNAIDINDILVDFNRRTGLGKEDPVVYFYEEFLNIYEKEQKKRRGVYYTPAPVVDFIVKSVDYLLKANFTCPKGLLADNVSILDPATGTGTFLREVILQVHANFSALHSAESWSHYVSNSLLKRLFGFEFMMAPYAVAHMKLAMTLKDTEYDFSSSQRMQVYLTNSLETELAQAPSGLSDPLYLESYKAASVRSNHINVVMGNPPYRADSINQGSWIMNLMDDYKKEPGTTERLHERNPKVVNDDYVKFIRFAQDIIKNQENAIVAYVTPHSYTDNLTFRGMRWNLLSTYSDIYILDLHGNAMSREKLETEEKDENIFDIQQGISITFLVKKTKEDGKMANVFYSEVCGLRSTKYSFLLSNTFDDISWTTVNPIAPYYFLKPKDFSEVNTYQRGVKLSELFPVSTCGIKTHDDENLVSMREFSSPFDQLYDYRPFDTRHVDYDLNKVERPRFEVMQNFLGRQNLGLVMDRQVHTDNWSHIQIVTNMIDNRLHYSHKGIPVVAPLYLYTETSVLPNIAEDKAQIFEVITGMEYVHVDGDHCSTFGPIDLLDYCYAYLHSERYREQYYDFLRTDFPYVPYPNSKEQFISLVLIGAELRNLHLLNMPCDNHLFIALVGNGDNMVQKTEFSNQRLYINKKQYFENIREDIWEFPFAGYRSLQKWFKDRKGTVLSETDICHVIQVFNVLDRTEELMVDIDNIV